MSFLPYPPPPEPGWYDDDVTVMAQPTAEPVDNAADSLETRERLAAQNESDDHDMQDVSVAKGDAAVSDEDDIDWDGTVLSEAFTMKQPKHTYVLDNEQTGQQVIVDMGVTITPQIANCLYTGIATDTGCFKFASTTPRTHMAAARVMEAGADVEKLNARLFESRSHARITAERMAMESLEYYFNDLCAVICLTWDQIESSGVAGAELEDLTSLPRSIEGVEVGLTYRQQRDGSFRISVRTSGNIDACNIARRLGGGGHTRAAGCEISGNLDNAKHAVLEEVRKELQRCGLLDQDAG